MCFLICLWFNFLQWCFYSFQYISLTSLVKTYSKYFTHFDSIINEKKTCFYDLVQLILATTFLWVKSQFCPHIKTDEDVQVKSEGWFVRFWFWFWAWTILLCQICKQHEMETGIPLLLASWIWYVGQIERSLWELLGNSQDCHLHLLNLPDSFYFMQ